MKLKMPIFRLFGNIERVDEETRTVVGYCYRNADPGDGWVVPRDVMERMTTDYMAYANVREMHQPSAVGKVTELTWDANGCLMRAQIVDDQAWEKVKAGVYTAYSIGVKPSKIKRSAGKKHLEDGSWYETSLVDRPADPGSVFTISRAEGDDTEFDVEVVDDDVTRSDDQGLEDAQPLTRGTFADMMGQQEKYTLRYAAMEVLGSILYDIQESKSTNKAGEIRSACSEFADYIAPIIGRGEFGGPESVLAEATALIRGVATPDPAEIETLNRTITERDATIEELRRRVEELEAEPDPTQNRPIVNAAEVVKRLRDSHEAKQANTDVAEAEREVLSRDWSNATDAERRKALDRLAELRRG